MKYLSRIRLDRTAPTAALSQLLDPPQPGARMDAHHRLIWTLFPSQADQQRDFLWRADGKGRFFILSARPPVANDLFCKPLDSKEFAPDLAPGDKLAFVLRANATKDRPRSKLQDGKNRRVDIVMDALKVVPQQDRAARRFELAAGAGKQWLASQGARNGFALVDFGLEDYSTVPLPGRKARQKPGKSPVAKTHPQFGILDMHGALTVEAPDLFLRKLYAGFGRAKGFGCGLMLIRRA